MSSLQERIDRLQAATAHGAAVEQLMLHEDVLGAWRNGTANEGASTTYVVVFESRRRAILKPFGCQHPNACFNYGQDEMETVTHEVVAWRLAYAMGDPWESMVPVAVLRDVPEAGRGGALINWRDGDPNLDVLSDAQSQVYAAAFWDALIGQQDRHIKNFRYDAASRGLAAIDNGFAFARPDDFCNASYFASFRHSQAAASLSDDELDALATLLETGNLHGLRDFLALDRADALQARAERMLETRMLPAPGAF